MPVRSAGRHFLRRLAKEGLSADILSLIGRTLFSESPIAAIAGHLEVERLFKKSPQLKMLTAQFPDLPNKYLNIYLAKSFDKRVRRACLLHHYRFFQNRAIGSFYFDTIGKLSVLWEHSTTDRRFSIALTFDRWHSEGDLSLVFLEGNTTLYEMAFSVIAGNFVGSVADDVLLITRVQGVKDQFHAIRTATRQLRDIPPAHFLMVAAQAIASALRVPVIAGVGNAEQLSKIANKYFIPFDYDSFWQVFLAEKSGSNFFVMPVPLRHKPLELIGVEHRRRTRRKREFKKQVADQVKAAFVKIFLLDEMADQKHVPAIRSGRAIAMNASLPV